ncbi:hypothetical protein GCM10009753_29070 [Streptantibioticus ferralitis]
MPFDVVFYLKPPYHRRTTRGGRMNRSVRTIDDVLRLMDSLFAPDADRWTTTDGSAWWDGFYADRSKPIPFFVAKPDENLVSYLDRSLLTPGRALDLGQPWAADLVPRRCRGTAGAAARVAPQPC